MRKRITYSERPNHAARSAHARGERQFRNYDTSHIHPKKSKAPLIVGIVLALAVVGVGIWAAFTFLGDSDTLAKGETVEITVPEGASTREIGTLLQENRVVASSGDFVNRVNALSVAEDIWPGTYVFTGPLTLDEAIVILQAGPVDTSDTFTIPEGFTLERVAERVEESYPDTITRDAFIEQAHNAGLYAAEYPFVEGAYNNSLEGFLFPKTYTVEEGATADTVIRQMLDQYRAEVANLSYVYAQEQGLSEYEVLILASVIEREAAADNKATVASVFYNRLAIEMPLQSDATTAYVIGGDPTPEDLLVEGPYNTYLNNGLPAGPICSPGLDSLRAACDPEQTPYYYFYFREEDESMAYYFSETYEQHNEAIFS